MTLRRSPSYTALQCQVHNKRR